MTSDDRDPLAEVLALLRPEAVLAAEVRASGRWSLAFDRHPGVKFGVVVEGECLIAVRGRSAKTLRAGDVFLLGGPPPFVMASDMGTPSRSASELFRSTKTRVVQLGGASGGVVDGELTGFFTRTHGRNARYARVADGEFEQADLRDFAEQPVRDVLLQPIRSGDAQAGVRDRWAQSTDRAARLG
ncbi:MAG: cupin domain-containing protein [Nibricoccus sp.]